MKKQFTHYRTVYIESGFSNQAKLWDEGSILLLAYELKQKKENSWNNSNV